MPPPTAVNILLQLVSGLNYAHQRGIIHRDINTTNVFVQRDDHIKILDFGLACPIGTEDLSSSGTADYMAPEQIRGEPLDPWVDIYALGIMAFEMVTGKRPYKAENLSHLLDIHLNHDIPDPGEIEPNLPDGLRHFICKSCNRDRSQRYKTTAQALSTLQLLANDLGLTPRYHPQEQRKMSTVFLIFKDENQYELNRLMETFTLKAKELGVEVKVSDLQDL